MYSRCVFRGDWGKEREQKIRRLRKITLKQVAEIRAISRSKAYQIVREMNRELKSQGYLTVAGKCPAQYFKQKFYSFQIPGGERNDGK